MPISFEEINERIDRETQRRNERPQGYAGQERRSQSNAKPNGPDSQPANDSPDQFPRKLDLIALSKKQPAPPPFIIADWLPQGEVTLFASHGGAGKSYIALYLAVCIAAGIQFFGLSVQRRRVAFYSCEDRAEILHWRLSRICAWLDIDMASLAGWLTIWDQSHADAALMTDTRDGLEITAVYEWVRDHLGEAQVLIVDGASDAFDGDEIRRRHVRKFVRQVRRLIPDDGAALLLAHVNALTARNADTAQAFSGSTAWHNSVRARWYLRAVDTESEDLLLETQKGNHSGRGQSMTLRWNESAHLFLGELAVLTSKFERDLAQSDEREAVLDLVRAAQQAGNPVPAAVAGPRTSWHVLSAMPGFPKSLAGRSGRARLFAVLETLQAARVLTRTTEKYGQRNSREVLHAA
jgi:RecA-family ATPase